MEVANSLSFSYFFLIEIKKVDKTHPRKSEKAIDHSPKSILDGLKHNVFSIITSENDELCAWNGPPARLVAPYEISLK